MAVTQVSNSPDILSPEGESITSNVQPSLPEDFSTNVFLHMNSVGEEANGSRIYGDMDNGACTVVTEDQDALALVKALEACLREKACANPECVLPLHAPTATTLATIVEAAQVCPRIEVGQDQENETVGHRFRLPIPDQNLLPSISTVLTRRHSTRSFASLDLQLFSTLLFHTARVRTAWIAEDGFVASRRLAPSAGARHPIDLIIVTGTSQRKFAPPENETGAYLFDPFTCELICLSHSAAAKYRPASQYATKLIGEEPPLVVVFRGRWNRTSSRYHGGISLLYRDAGALMTMFSIVSAALNIGCCPLAQTYLKAPLDASDFPHRLDELDLGGVAIGALGSDRNAL